MTTSIWALLSLPLDTRLCERADVHAGRPWEQGGQAPNTPGPQIHAGDDHLKVMLVCRVWRQHAGQTRSLHYQVRVRLALFDFGWSAIKGSAAAGTSPYARTPLRPRPRHCSARPGVPVTASASRTRVAELLTCRARKSRLPPLELRQHPATTAQAECMSAWPSSRLGSGCRP